MSRAAHLTQEGLFADFPEPVLSADCEWNKFVSAGGVVIRYGREHNLFFPLDFGNGEKVEARRYKKRAGGNDQFRVAHPVCGEVFSRFTNKRAFLAAVAAAIQYKTESKRAADAERLAAIARHREREAGGRLVDATLAEANQDECDGSAPAKKARTANKLKAGQTFTTPEGGYVNPFTEGWDHSHTPDWFDRERGPSDLTKRVFGRLLFPPEVCDRYDKPSGVIYGPNIAWLASSLGASEKGVRKAMHALRDEWRVIACTTTQNGSIVELRFLNHEWLQTWKVEKDGKRRAKADQKEIWANRNTVPAARNSVPLTRNSVPAKPEHCSGFHSVREIENQEKRETDSGAREPETANQETREQRRVGELDRFALDASAIDDPLWTKLCDAVGRGEMIKNGLLWRKRYRLCRDALATAVSDFKSMTPANQKTYNAAAYITAVFEKEKRPAASPRYRDSAAERRAAERARQYPEVTKPLPRFV